MNTRIQKFGNELGLIIPQPYAEALGISEGTEVLLSVDYGALIVRPANQPLLEELLADMDEWRRHREVGYDDRVGREEW